MMMFENGMSLLRGDGKDLAKENLRSLRRIVSRYRVTIPAVAMGEIVSYICTKVDTSRRRSCFEWLWNFVDEYGVDVMLCLLFTMLTTVCSALRGK